MTRFHVELETDEIHVILLALDAYPPEGIAEDIIAENLIDYLRNETGVTL